MNYRLSTLLGSMVLGSALIFGLGACKKKDDGGGGGGGQIAQTPQVACNAPQSGACNPGYYSVDPTLMVPQAYTNGYNNGYCGCQANYRPIYNQQWGFACAPANTFTYSAYMGYNYNSVYQPQNNTALTIGQVYYSPVQYGGQTGSCYNDFALSCDVRVANSCTNGGICRPIGGGSSIGVCTQGVGVDTYNGAYTNNPYSTYSYGNGYYPYNSYGGGGTAYSGGNCQTRTTSWGLSYYYCY